MEFFPTTKLEEITKITKKHTKVVTKETTNGTLVFTEYGARLLGLFPNNKLPNLLWVDSKLDEKMAEGNWMIGGERLWIAPERNFFYENPRDFDGFHVPAEIDPGEYDQIDELTFESNFALLDYHTNETFDNSIARRQFQVINDPYNTGLDFAGVQIKDLLSISSPNMTMCGWSLAQVYTCGKGKPGTALFPIKPSGKILSYFSPIPSTRASVEQGYAKFLIDSAEIYKFAIMPEDMVFSNPIKAVYVSPFPNSKEWFCIVKRTDDMPRSQAECVDIARDNPNGPRGAIQSYNNGPGFGGGEVIPFGEIELQLNKGAFVNNRTISMAIHDILGYAGKKEEILGLAMKLLRSQEIPKIF